MNTSIRLRLSIMMFLQYVVWAAWYVTMGRYLQGTLNFTGQEVGIAYNSTALAAMISPFFVGMVADRFFPTEKVLCALHILGGVLMLALSQATTFATFYTLLIAHTLCYMPTLALTNSISFHQMKDPGKEFPSIRVLGTISWIITVWAVGRLSPLDVTTPIPFQIAGGISILMGLYCLTLPHTPPKAKGEKVTARDVLGLDALKLLKERSFTIFVISAFLISIPLSFYFSFAPVLIGDVLALPANASGTVQEGAAASLQSAMGFLPGFARDAIVRSLTNATEMTIYGQLSEIFFLLVMPWFFIRLGVKYMLMVGMFSWGFRYLLFIMGYNAEALWPVFLGVLLHGVCYDFFFVTAYIYVDKKASESMRAKAQGFIAFVTLGAGMFVGTSLSGTIVSNYSFPEATPAKFQTVQDQSSWATGNIAKWDEAGTAAFGTIDAIITDGSEVTGVPSALVGTTNAPAARLEIMTLLDGVYATNGVAVAKPLSELSRPVALWNHIWLIPAVGALAIMVLFAVLFRHREEPQSEAKENV